jgi:hypothetical protein
VWSAVCLGFEIFQTPQKGGWGVRATRGFRVGELVVEYVGEVIDYEEVAVRRREQLRKVCGRCCAVVFVSRCHVWGVQCVVSDAGCLVSRVGCRGRLHWLRVMRDDEAVVCVCVPVHFLSSLCLTLPPRITCVLLWCRAYKITSLSSERQ